MPEWVKLVVSALLGLIAGLLIEPLKIMIGNRAKVHLLRDGIYSNLAFISGKCNWLLVDDLRQSKTKVIFDEYFGEIKYTDRPQSEEEILDELASIDLDVFDYYYNREKPIFWRLEFASRLNSIYSAVRASVDTSVTPSARLDAARGVDKMIRRSLKDGTLNAKLFLHYSRKCFGDDYTTAYYRSLARKE
jgi:hypothetical protein